LSPTPKSVKIAISGWTLGKSPGVLLAIGPPNRFALKAPVLLRFVQGGIGSH